MAFAESYDERLSAYEGLIQAVSLERGIKHPIRIAIDEWGIHRISADVHKDVPIRVDVDECGNMCLPPSGGSVRRRQDRIIMNLEDTLVTALHLNTFIRHAASVRMANFTHMPTMGMIDLTRPNSPVLLQTIFYPFELYSRTCGQLALDVFWHGDTFSGTYNDRSYVGIRTLDVAATLDESRKRLVVYVINQNKEKAMEAVISLTSGQFAGNMQISVINGPDVKAENTYEKPDQVRTRETTIKALGKTLTFTFEPHSVTALVCAIR